MTEEEKRRELARRKRIRREKRRKKLIWKRRILIGCMVLILVLIVGLISSIRSCHQKAVETDAKIQAEKEAKEKKKREEAEKKEKEEHTLHMVAVGDNFFHDTVLADGQQESGVWSYDYIYENAFACLLLVHGLHNRRGIIKFVLSGNLWHDWTDRCSSCLCNDTYY